MEIHLANMMDKLGATHAADAVRLRMEAVIPGGAEAASQPVLRVGN